jgi:hypothetical protein
MSCLLAGNLVSELASWGLPPAAALSLTYVTHRLLIASLTFTAVFSKNRNRRSNARKVLVLLTRTQARNRRKR